MTELQREVKRFFELLDTTDETDSGKIFYPISINCCRVLLGIELEKCLLNLKELIKEDTNEN